MPTINMDSRFANPSTAKQWGNSMSAQATLATSRIGSAFLRSGNQQFASGVPGASQEATEESVGPSAASAAAELDPEVLLAQVGQQIGSGMNTLWTSLNQNSINANYLNTLSNGHGVGLQEQATNQASADYANNSLQDLGGKIGAMFGGPLGVLLGRGLFSLFEAPVTGAVAYSAQGKFNPQTGGTDHSQSSVPENPSPVVLAQGPREEANSGDPVASMRAEPQPANASHDEAIVFSDTPSTAASSSTSTPDPTPSTSQAIQ